jgi:hypothetical protein
MKAVAGEGIHRKFVIRARLASATTRLAASPARNYPRSRLRMHLQLWSRSIEELIGLLDTRAKLAT